MTESRTTFQFMPIHALLGVLAAIGITLSLPSPFAEARPSKCFGKKINKVVKGSNKTVRLAFKDVAWVEGNKITVIGKPHTTVCAGAGSQTILAGKGSPKIDAGPGDDKIVLHNKSEKAKVYGGLGDDVIIGSKGHDYLQGGPKKNPRGASDRDVIDGRGGNDKIYDYTGVGNVLMGDTGSDSIYSLGDAVSIIRGGNGSDFLYSNGGQAESGQIEMLFGERGNDRLRADRRPVNGPAFFDGGSGDDWIYGTSRDDTIIFQSGITKVKANAGDDLIIATGTAMATVDGGPGKDLISFASHTPPGYRGSSGVLVDLRAGYAQGNGAKSSLSGIEAVSGSSFDDQIIGKPGQTDVLDGGPGDDQITGQHEDKDTINGGPGQNSCFGVRLQTNCNESSPGTNDFRQTLVGIDATGLLTVIGSNSADRIDISYSRSASTYKVKLADPGIASGQCYTATQKPATEVICPVDRHRMNGMLIYGNRGDDRIEVGNTVPDTVTTTINAGTGKSTVLGGKGRDQIMSEVGSAGSVLNGRAGGDDIRIHDAVIAKGGPGHDSIHTRTPCVGATAIGGPDQDNMVFAGSPRGVEANLQKGFGRLKGGCAKPLRLKSLESLEGTEYDDHLVIGKRRKDQQGKSALLGRGGIDRLDSRNGRRDAVTTGDGGRKNKVIADRQDKVIWGWGLSAS